MVTVITVILFVVCFVLLIVYLFPLAVVEGNSMLPTYNMGDILLCARIHRKNRDYRPGEIIVFRAPYEDEKYFVIKRVSFSVKQDNTNYLFVLGDNPKESYDSRMYGLINCKCVVAKVLFTVKRCTK